MKYVHSDNILKKIKDNYGQIKDKLQDFYDKKYVIMRNKIEKYDFSSCKIEGFKFVTSILNMYYSDLQQFARVHNITSQSKFESTFLEEISVYLFGNLDVIKEKKLDIFNKKIYAGLKIDNNINIAY